ncbi:MAG: 4-hydroxy-3-methylbut-2-enyl diphosphate reductase [Mariprofundaceae bacterium]|nr:4-hydroxy-3-methylbut-2-enyl diphosphate reductase [Mariprofundaceae bacterium]
MQVLLAEPRGFCAGVDRAIAVVEQAIEQFGAPVYVRHEIVHNHYVVEGLRDKGAVFIDEVDDAPDGALLIFSAHGVSKAVQKAARERDVQVIDATCPLVTKVHMELIRHYRLGDQVILIGHAGHPEVEGTMGQAPEGAVLLVSEQSDVDDLEVQDPGKLAYVTQTTLSVDDTRDVVKALQQRFPAIVGPKRDDICYATTNRQEAVKAMAGECDVVLVIGSKNSSNSNRLREVAERMGARAYLLDTAADVYPEWLAGAKKIGVTAGASAPEELVQGLMSRLRELGASADVQTLKTAEEKVFFHLPDALKSAKEPNA